MAELRKFESRAGKSSYSQTSHERVRQQTYEFATRKLNLGHTEASRVAEVAKASSEATPYVFDKNLHLKK